MQRGTVKIFFWQPGKRYGFIIGENGNEIFFHFNQGKEFIAGTFRPLFSSRMQTRDPKTGDEVCLNSRLDRRVSRLIRGVLWMNTDGLSE